MTMKSGRKVGLLLSLLLLGVTGCLWWQRQAVFDWIQLRNYEPPAAIAHIATATTMNDKGRRIFYVNRPTLENKEQFNTICTDQLNVTEHTNILGCYHGGQRGIFIYDIQDKRLDGVEEVTAAHEMLHAAYDRISTSERKRIDKLLTDYFNNHVDNDRIKTNIEIYRKSDASVVPNELHSILATEVRELSPELEQYYTRYFTDRLKIVELNEKYETLFEALKQEIADYDAQLSDLIDEINTLEQSLTNERKSLEQASKRLEALQAFGQIAEYNAGVPVYNKRLRKFNEGVNEFNGLVDRYKTVLVDRNNAAFVRTDLYESISSQIQPL